jgi:hypothetical protein
MGGFGASLRTKLRFAANSVFTSTSGVAVTQDWSLNSPYDPDITSTGVQPTNFDDFMLHYFYFRVHRVSVQITMACRTATIPMEYVVYPRVGGTATAFVDAESQPMAQVGTFGTMNAPPKVVRFNAKIDDLVGPFQYSQLLGTAAGNPTVNVALRHTIKSSDGSTTAIADVLTVITYDVEFTERIPTDLDYYKRLEKYAQKQSARLLQLDPRPHLKPVRKDLFLSGAVRSEPDEKEVLSDDDEKAWSDLDTAVQSARVEGSTRTEIGGLGKPLLRQPVSTLPAHVSSRRSDMSAQKGDRKNQQ